MEMEHVDLGMIMKHNLDKHSVMVEMKNDVKECIEVTKRMDKRGWLDILWAVSCFST
jgi:hypothetical protein